MKKLLLVLAIATSLFSDEIIIKESSCSVDKTIQNIKNLVTRRGLSVFGVIDHQKNADLVNMQMPESKLIIFGNPKIGTTYMLQNMKSGLDLPLKILVYKDKDSKVKIIYRDILWLVENHNLGLSLRSNKINDAMDKITNKAGICTKD